MEYSPRTSEMLKQTRMDLELTSLILCFGKMREKLLWLFPFGWLVLVGSDQGCNGNCNLVIEDFLPSFFFFIFFLFLKRRVVANLVGLVCSCCLSLSLAFRVGLYLGYTSVVACSWWHRFLIMVFCPFKYAVLQGGISRIFLASIALWIAMHAWIRSHNLHHSSGWKSMSCVNIRGKKSLQLDNFLCGSNFLVPRSKMGWSHDCMDYLEYYC